MTLARTPPANARSRPGRRSDILVEVRVVVSVTKHSSVPLVDQIADQIIAAVASGELPPGHRLPSIRALAARLKIHANSVRAAYLHLASRGWIQLRAGSGAYVSHQYVHSGLTTLALNFVSAARALGADEAAIRQALDEAFASALPERVVVVEPEDGLRDILVAEIEPIVPLPVAGLAIPPRDSSSPRSVVTALAARATSGDLRNSDGHNIVWLHVNSAADLMTRYKRPPSTALITFASRSPALLRIASGVLVAAGWDPNALVVQDARKRGWKRSLPHSDVVIADSITLPELPAGSKAWHLRVIAESSLQELLARCTLTPKCDTSQSVPME